MHRPAPTPVSHTVTLSPLHPVLSPFPTTLSLIVTDNWRPPPPRCGRPPPGGPTASSSPVRVTSSPVPDDHLLHLPHAPSLSLSPVTTFPVSSSLSVTSFPRASFSPHAPPPQCPVASSCLHPLPPHAPLPTHVQPWWIRRCLPWIHQIQR
jgi:hypothetical protein